jgi:hypothetical protein
VNTSVFSANLAKNILSILFITKDFYIINLELLEETGIKSSDIDVDPNFRFEHVII